MSATSLDLQSAIVTALKTPAVFQLTNGVYDRVPEDPWGTAQAYISFGPESALSVGDCARIDNISIQLDIWSRHVGRVNCKQIMAAVYEAMVGLTLESHNIVSRAEPFQQIVQDPDGLTIHGVMRYEFGIEVDG